VNWFTWLFIHVHFYLLEIILHWWIITSHSRGSRGLAWFTLLLWLKHIFHKAIIPLCLSINIFLYWTMHLSIILQFLSSGVSKWASLRFLGSKWIMLSGSVWGELIFKFLWKLLRVSILSGKLLSEAPEVPSRRERIWYLAFLPSQNLDHFNELCLILLFLFYQSKGLFQLLF